MEHFSESFVRCEFISLDQIEWKSEAIAFDRFELHRRWLNHVTRCLSDVDLVDSI